MTHRKKPGGIESEVTSGSVTLFFNSVDSAASCLACSTTSSAFASAFAFAISLSLSSSSSFNAFATAAAASISSF